MTLIKRIDADPFLVLSAIIRARPRHQRSIMEMRSSRTRNLRERVGRPEYLGVTRDEVAAACRVPSRYRFDIMRETIIPIGGMEAGHSEQVFKNMFGQIAATKLLVAPLFQRDINIGDSSTERG